MDWASIAEVLVIIGGPAAAAIGLGGRRRRLRVDVRENLSILEKVRSDPLLTDHTPAIGWLSSRIAADVAKISGFSINGAKKPVPVGPAIFTALVALVLGLWTYLIVRDGFVWYAVFPATGSALMLVTWFGMFMNRTVVSSDLPEGASPIKTDTAEERLGSKLQWAASGADMSMWEPGGQAEIALKFFELLRGGKFEEGAALAEPNWILCRIQARMWNLSVAEGLDVTATEERVDRVFRAYQERQPSREWQDFCRAEGQQFAEAWSDGREWGAASRRRRISREYDLVVLAPTGAEGYFVTSAVQLPNAITLLLRRVEDGWLVANHLGSAPPKPGLPPVWWSTMDTTFNDIGAVTEAQASDRHIP